MILLIFSTLTQKPIFYIKSESISITIEFISKMYKIPLKHRYTDAHLMTNDGYLKKTLMFSWVYAQLSFFLSV